MNPCLLAGGFESNRDPHLNTVSLLGENMVMVNRLWQAFQHLSDVVVDGDTLGLSFFGNLCWQSNKLIYQINA
jgi:hypothetical protein